MSSCLQISTASHTVHCWCPFHHPLHIEFIPSINTCDSLPGFSLVAKAGESSMESRSEVSMRKQDNAPRRSLNQWLLWVRDKCFHMFTMSNLETCASQPPRAPSKTEPSWPSAEHYSLLLFSVSLTPWWVLHGITCQMKSLHSDTCLWVCFWGPQLKTDTVGCPVIQESVEWSQYQAPPF